jgi:hypothetical protein
MMQGNVPPQGPGMMSQMPTAPGGCYQGGYNGGGYANGYGDGSACGQNGQNMICGAGNECQWYASVAALAMGRSDGRRVWTSYEDGNLTNQLTNTDYPLAWRWGGEAKVGHRFCCECVPYALEGVYWTVNGFSGERTTAVAGGYVSTPLDLNSFYFGATPAATWFDGAKEHHLWRRDELHNLELNWVREQLPWGCDSGWEIGWSMGVRYFRFEDCLEFGTLAHSGTGWDDLPATAYLRDRATNNLIGPQFGFDASYRVCETVRLFISPKVGFYDNFMDNTFEATTGNGIHGHGPYAVYPVKSNRNGVAFLTQIDLGVDWRFAQNWSARAGYRVVAVSGMALSDGQIPQYICDSPDIEDTQHTSSLVLHGAVFGVTYNF